MKTVSKHIIPQVSRTEGDVVLARSEYERLLSRARSAHETVILEEVPLMSLTPAQRKAYREAKRTPLSKMSSGRP